MTPRERLTPKEIQIAILVWEGLTNREIGRIVGTSEQVIKNHLRSTFDKLGVWSRLELAMYVASHGGKDWPEADGAPASYPQGGGSRLGTSQFRITTEHRGAEMNCGERALCVSMLVKSRWIAPQRDVFSQTLQNFSGTVTVKTPM